MILDDISAWFQMFGIHPVIGGMLVGALLMFLLRLKRPSIPKSARSKRSITAAPSSVNAMHSSHSLQTIDVMNEGKKIQVPEEVNEKLMEHLRNGEKIMAIKIFREATGLGLKESKDVVEAM